MVFPFRPHALPGVIQAQLDRVLPAYEAHVNNQGCSASLFSKLTGTARHLIAWLTVNESDVAALDIRGVDGFLSHDCDCPAEFRSQRDAPSPWHAHRGLGYLLETGQAAMPSSIVTGGGLVEALAGTLTAQGYQEATVRDFRNSCRHLIVWLYRSDLALAEIDGGVLQRFLDHDCACQHPQFFGRANAFSGSRKVKAISRSVGPLPGQPGRGCGLAGSGAGGQQRAPCSTPCSAGCASIAAPAKQPSGHTPDPCESCCRGLAMTRAPMLRCRSARPCWAVRNPAPEARSSAVSCVRTCVFWQPRGCAPRVWLGPSLRSRRRPRPPLPK